MVSEVVGISDGALSRLRCTHRDDRIMATLLLLQREGEGHDDYLAAPIGEGRWRVTEKGRSRFLEVIEGWQTAERDSATREPTVPLQRRRKRRRSSEARLRETAESRDEDMATEAGTLTEAVSEAQQQRLRRRLASLIRRLSAEDPEVRWNAARSLGQIGAPAVQAVPALTKCLSDWVAQVRWWAAQALGQIGEPAVPALSRRLSNSAAQVRWWAARVLGRIGEPAVPALVEHLSDDDPEVRWWAAGALTTIGEPAVPGLIDRLGAETAQARRAVVWALGRIGEGATDAVPAMQRLLDDPDDDVSDAAGEALEQILRPRR